MRRVLGLFYGTGMHFRFGVVGDSHEEGWATPVAKHPRIVTVADLAHCRSSFSVPLELNNQSRRVVTSLVVYFSLYQQLVGDDDKEHYSELFDRDFYLENNPDVKACGIDPFEHYQRFGRFESRIPCGRVPMSVLQQHPEYHSLIQQKDDNFDAQFYLRTYLPAAMAFLLHNIHPQQHFQLFGK